MTVSPPSSPTLHDPFGDQVPYGDPSWYQAFQSPYYNASHVQFRAAMRQWVEEYVVPHVGEWSEANKVPQSLLKDAYKAGWLPALADPHRWHTEYAGEHIIGGIKPHQYDAFHNYIVHDELGRIGAGGVVAGLGGGMTIGLPPVLHFGSNELKQRIVPACMRGERVISLCITEPSVGSDVANLRTTATKTSDGKYYIVNGEKKWITTGMYSDYFTVACRTGGNGAGGVSFVLVEREMGGVTTRQMKCQGQWGAGTGYVTFDNVKVPVSNLIGEENHGFKYIMYNFNPERISICSNALRQCRVAFEESWTYAHKRKTFGKRLIDHPVIRQKLAHMSRQIESTQHFMDNIVYQTIKMPREESNKKLGGTIALLKVQVGTTLDFCAREASQVFGGLAYTRTGQGEKVERIYRDVKFVVIAGGSEEIMADLGIREAMRQWKSRQETL